MERLIDGSTTIRVPLARAQEVLLDDPGAVLSETRTADDRRERTFQMDMGLDLGAGASVRQSVSVKLGIPRPIDDGLVLPLAWHATGREEWLPTFTGELAVTAARQGTRVRLSGVYTVPFGVVGRFGDGVLGRRLARRSLRALVERLAGHLESEAQAHLDSAGWRPAPRPVDLREQGPSEIYIG
jgi:hypothetical protein